MPLSFVEEEALNERTLSNWMLLNCLSLLLFAKFVFISSNWCEMVFNFSRMNGLRMYVAHCLIKLIKLSVFCTGSINLADILDLILSSESTKTREMRVLYF